MPTNKLPARWACPALAALLSLAASSASAFEIHVVNPQGQPVTGFRWLVEEDTTFRPQPGVTLPSSLGMEFHRSYMPVIGSGDSTSARLTVDPLKYYFVSVLPDTGYTISGASVAPGQAAVTITVQPLPLPTAQISIFVYQDNRPINNQADLPQESGLPGFSILLFEAGGRYGASGGQVTQDAFGNPLGTTYALDAAGQPRLDGDGNPVVDVRGSGTLTTSANGELFIKYLSPGKYGVQAVPPPGSDWIQTSTIEGTKTIDAWVKPGEPPYFAEFGPPGYHVELGFLRPFFDATRLVGTSAINGQVVNNHLSRPPDYVFYDGAPLEHTTAWVGLNDLAGGLGTGLSAARCDGEGRFSIPNVPPGTYQLVVWDEALDFIFALADVTVPPGGADVNLGNVPVFQWFSRLGTYVFNDVNQNGVWEVPERGLPGVPVNLRWRDGSLYQMVPTDNDGYAPFDEVFPFFSWLVVEVDATRFKATGLTSVVDNGGPIDPNDPWSFGGALSPQLWNGLPYRTELGPVVTQAFQGFLGQTSVVQWGKAAYSGQENGGISGFVAYGTTRAENDPRQAATEPWEPGVPRVQMNLYTDADFDGVVDDLNRDGVPTLADVDNAPPLWRSLGVRGAEDVDRNGNGAFDEGDAIAVTTTDSWDDNQPTGCPGDPADPFYLDGRCYDGLRNFNQVRPGTYDGRYTFTGIPSGNYIVEASVPRSPFGSGYLIAKEEDRNVDFGDRYVPVPMALQAPCVGDPHVVPPVLSLFPAAGEPAPFAGERRPLCDRKTLYLSNTLNGVVNFTLFTEVPPAAHILGFVLDDTANEFDRTSPQFGEKYAPPWLPISIRDFTGHEITRVYSDQYGVYNALVPSTYTIDRPFPSGVAPNMLTACLNDPAMPDPNNPGHFLSDPYFNKQYSQFCYTFQYMPGTTTYLDTPVVKVAAFAGPDQYPLDCEQPNGVPELFSVSGPSGGPHLSALPQNLTLVSRGSVQVPNPAYDPALGTPKTIRRDYGFGTAVGTVRLGNRVLPVVSWTNTQVVVRAVAGSTTGQLLLTRGDNGRVTPAGVTVTVGGPGQVLRVAQGGSIQAAIDAAPRNALILVPPGEYREMVILWKPVRLQGWGAASTIINAVGVPAEKKTAWRQKVVDLIAANQVSLLPGQQGGGVVGVEPGTLFTEEGAALLVLPRNASVGQGGFGRVQGEPNARIDGFTLTGSDHAGGLIVNGYAHSLQLSNNIVSNNTGFYGGGIRVGHPLLTVETPQGLQYQSAFNDNLTIHHNLVLENGGLGEAGGGISLYTGSTSYSITENFICGNFTMGEGAGIGHLGLSTDGYIGGNTILFNQSFNQGQTVSGGGILVAGAEPLVAGGLSPGAGTVRVVANLLQGNLAGAGDGGGIRGLRVNGQDVAANSNQPDSWYSLRLFNNIIVNNVAALAGGAISLQDTARAYVLHNTIVHNDAVGTAGEAFTPGSPNQSNPQPAGVVARAHSAALAAAFGPHPRVNPFRAFSNPDLINNIIWENRSFFFLVNDAVDPPEYVLQPNSARPIWDLAVLGTAAPQSFDPRFNLLTTPAGTHPSNFGADPGFVAAYFNGARNAVVVPEITTSMQVMPAFDEGGNFIDVRFGPLTTVDPTTGLPFGDYHLTATSPAQARGSISDLNDFPMLEVDFDGDERPNPPGQRPDVGADER